MPGRIESYIHSDSTTEHKGGVMVKVTSDTDFAAQTDVFKNFAKEAAKLAYATVGRRSSPFIGGPYIWAETIAQFPDLEIQRLAAEAELKENVLVTEIAMVRLT